jgi:hypothetical protein
LESNLGLLIVLQLAVTGQKLAATSRAFLEIATDVMVVPW